MTLIKTVVPSYGGWYTHGGQRQIQSILATDLNNRFQNRGIENGHRKISGGKLGNSAGVFHGAFSALWQSLVQQSDKDKIVIIIAGKLGRQISHNSNAETDHGRGNLMFVIGEPVMVTSTVKCFQRQK